VNAADLIQGGVDPKTGANRHARLQRDAALRRVGTISRTIAVASIAAAVAIGVYVSRAVPGHTSTSSTSGTAPGAPATGATGNTGSTGSTGTNSNGLAPPNNPPVQTPQPAPVVSGST
jgi:hypothetical protein